MRELPLIARPAPRHGMVVLCDEFALADDSNWSALLQHARSRNLLTSTEPEVVLMPPSRPLTDEEAFDEEQEKLASLLQSLLRPKSEGPSNMRIMREATDQDEVNPLKSTAKPQSSASSQSSRSVRRKSSSSRSRSPRSPAATGTGSAKAKPQKPGPINALFFHGVDRLPGA